MFSLGLLCNPEKFKCKTIPCPSTTNHLGICKSFVVSASAQNEILYFSLPFFEEPACFPQLEPVLEIATNSSLALFLTCRNIWVLGEDSQSSGLFGMKDVVKSQIPVKLQGTPDCLLNSISLSECHGGFICDDGSLFTWGRGTSGELGRRDVRQSEVKKVENGYFFKGKQVACGNEFTAVVTQGGFLYVYGNRGSCRCGGANGYPATIFKLEEHFVAKVYAFKENIALITDEQKVFVTCRGSCLFQLKASKAVNTLGIFDDGIFGLSCDKTRLYLWQAQNDQDGKNQWKSRSFQLPNDLFSIFSSRSQHIGLLGSDLHKLDSLSSSRDSSPEASHQSMQKERKSFEEIISNYNLQPVLSRTPSENESCKTLFSVLEKYFAESFRRIKEFAWIRSLCKKTYNYRFLIEKIEKTLKKSGLSDKNFAFFRLKRLRKAVKLQKIAKVSGKTLGLALKINLFRAITKNESKVLAFYLQVFRNSSKRPSQPLSGSLRHPFEISLRIIETHNQSRVKFLFNFWKILSKPQLPASLNNFSRIFCTFMARSLKPSPESMKSDPQMKIGLFILSSLVANVYRKRKTQSFNTLIRQVSYQRQSEGSFFDHQKVKKAEIDDFNPFSRENRNEKCFKLVLIFQGLKEKEKFRMVIKGFNAFVSNLMSKTLALDSAVSKTYSSKDSRFFVTPPCASPILDLMKRNSERSTLDTTATSNVRTASVNNLQECIRRRIQDIRKAGPAKKMKIIKKRTEGNTNLDKRIAYDEGLKERQRRRESSGLFTSCSSRKQSFFASPRNKSFIIQLD